MRLDRLSKEEVKGYATELRLNYYARNVQAMAQEILELRQEQGTPPVFDAKKPRLKRDWVGRRVMVQRKLRNGYVSILAGTVMMVRRNYSGLQLEGDHCGKCGIAPSITKVPEHDVRLLADE